MLNIYLIGKVCNLSLIERTLLEEILRYTTSYNKSFIQVNALVRIASNHVRLREILDSLTRKKFIKVRWFEQKGMKDRISYIEILVPRFKSLMKSHRYRYYEKLNIRINELLKLNDQTSS